MNFFWGSSMKQLTLLLLVLILGTTTSMFAQSGLSKTYGPGTGNVYSLAIDTNGVVYAGTGANGVYYYKNGETWKLLTTSLQGFATYAVAVDSRSHLYAGTDNGVCIVLSSSVRWAGAINGLKNQFITSLTINRSREINFAGTGGGGIFRSFDDGLYWFEADNGLKDKALHCLTTDANNVLYAGTDKAGVFFSTDNGTNWSSFGNGLPVSSILSLLASKSGSLFAGTREGLFRSSAKDQEWAPLQNGLKAKAIYALAQSATGNLYAGTDEGLFQSSDIGRTWVQVTSSAQTSAILSLVTDGKGHVYLGTDKGEVYVFNEAP